MREIEKMCSYHTRSVSALIRELATVGLRSGTHPTGTRADCCLGRLAIAQTQTNHRVGNLRQGLATALGAHDSPCARVGECVRVQA